MNCPAAEKLSAGERQLVAASALKFVPGKRWNEPDNACGFEKRHPRSAAELQKIRASASLQASVRPNKWATILVKNQRDS